MTPTCEKNDQPPRLAPPPDLLETRHHLHQGVKPALRSIQIPGDLGRPHLPGEADLVLRQRHVVLEAVSGDAVVARPLQPRRFRADVGQRHLVHEAPEAQPEVACQVPHGRRDLASELRELVLVVLHGLGEVHQVVEVDGVVGRLAVLEGDLALLVPPEPQLHPLRSDLDGVLVLPGGRLQGFVLEDGEGRLGVDDVGSDGAP